MTKNIVIPINNKGGVGKTSILADLSAALAQRFKVGIIDFDDQASLVGTLTGEDLACRSLDESDLKVRHSILTPSTRFMFQDNFGRLIIDVNETTAKLVAFPPGMLYDHPEKRQRLEEIVCREMAEETFLMIDLPPIPHPGMILDYTIMPIVESLGRDVRSDRCKEHAQRRSPDREKHAIPDSLVSPGVGQIEAVMFQRQKTPGPPSGNVNVGHERPVEENSKR